MYRCFLKLGTPKHESAATAPTWVDIRALAIVIWRQGFKRDTRWKFWHHLFSIMRLNPRVWEHYLTMCAHNEHFLEYRQIVKDQIEAQLAKFKAQEKLVEQANSEKVDAAIA